MKDLAARTKALEFIRAKQGPVLIGEMALHLGPLCSLREAEGILSGLASERLIRRMSPDELARIDLVIAYIAV